MYNYKVGDKFKWKEGKCFIEDYSSDVYELAQKDNGDIHGIMIMTTGMTIDMEIVMKNCVKE